MHNIEKAIVVLEKSCDGDALSPGHLHLTQMACNGQLTEAGQIAFEKIFGEVDTGTYVKPWLHGIENLVKNQSGYVTWKGVTIEHYSFRDANEEWAAAQSLGASCRSLEARGFPVTGKTISLFSPFASAPSGSPWVETMLHCYSMFAVDGRAKWLILDLPNGYGMAMSVMSGEIVTCYAFEPVGVVTLFRQLAYEGMENCSKRLEKYLTFVECMREAGITPEAVHRALNADISALLPPDAIAA